MCFIGIACEIQKEFEIMAKYRPEDEAEAERLRLLSVDERKRVIELIRSVADDPNVPEEDRQEAIARAEALSSILRLKLKPKKK